MEQGTWFFILKLLPYVAICSIIAFLLGLLFGRSKSQQASSSSTASNPAEENARIKKLQEKLHAAEADGRALRSELGGLKEESVSKAAHAALETDLQALRNELQAEKKRSTSLEADARKAQETTASLNNRLNNDAKAQKDRVISLENELSKARETLSQVGTKGVDTSAELRAELERAKETASSATRLVGEARKREASLLQELESLKSKSESSVAPKPMQGLLSLPTNEISTPAPASAAAARALEDVARLNAKRDAEAAERAAAAKEAAERAAAAKAAAEKAATERVAAEQAAADKAAAEQVAAEQAAADKAAAEQVAAEQAAAEQAAAEQAAAEQAAAEQATSEPAAVVAQPKEKIQEASDVLGKRVVRDDFKIVEGIGPKIEELIHAAGITTWEQLATTSVDRLREILANGGDGFAVHNPSTWPRQAEMANEGRWMGLKAWQDVLDGGKE